MARFEARSVRARDGREIVLRSVEPGEAEALLAFADHVDRTSEFNLTQVGERTMTVEQEREWLQKNLDEPGWLALGAYDENRIVGLVNFKCGEKRRIAHHGMFGISVHQELRGMGIGTELLRGLLEWAAASEGIEKVCLGVFEKNVGARRLYARMGFVEECRRKGYVKLGPGEYMDDIEMSRWVKAV